MSGDPDDQSQVSTLTTPDCPPIKKKPKATSTSKKFPTQKNKMTEWLVKPTPAVTTPTPSVSVTVATSTSASTTSTATATYTTPNVARAQPSIAPYTSTNIDSSWVTTTNDEIDYTRICAGCNNLFHSCSEGKWHKIYLHQVLDYLKDKNFDKISKRSVRKVYYRTSLLMMKAEVLKEMEYYKLEDNIHLPRCILEGSFREAFDLMDEDTAYVYMKTQRVHDVQRHLEKMRNDVFRGRCEEGEKIVETGSK